MKNLQKLMENLQDSAYFTFCEGDDYYFTINRLKLHLEQHQKNPELAITFNNLIILEEINGKTGYVIWDLIGGPERISTHMLAENNLVGNLGCIFVNSLCLENIEPKLFEMFSGDWFLSLFFSKFGALGFIDKPLSLYRKNGKGFWTGKNQDEKNKFLYDEIEKYDHFFQYSYSKEFTAYKKRLERESNFSIPTTVAVVDDISPHPISAFRYEEFSSILNEIDGSVLLSSGESCHVLGPDKIDELIIDFKRKNPKLATQVGKFNNQEKVQASLLYCVFVGNVHKVLQIAEAEKTPFVFTLYPGGLFGLNNRESDLALRRFMSSPQFMKVIVTNRVTENYLLEKNFCSPDKIEYIWGVVSPRGKLNLEPAKIRYGLDKTDLDICFVAHKYTSDGRDKGFDVFLQMAKLISITRTNVKFHVVGPWDENDYDTGGIRNINFYGVAEQGWFDTFYIDKDLIVSPNASGQIFKGSFDGFPTASVTDAAMRKVAMMVTDPMGLNDDNFEDGKDVLITSNDPTELVANLEFLLDNPSFLTSIAEAGYKKANYLYSVEKQIHPRIEILKNCLAEIEFNQQSEKVDNPRNGFQIEGNEGIHAPLEATGASFQSILYNFIRRMTPRSIKRAIRKVMRVWVIIRGL